MTRGNLHHPVQQRDERGAPRQVGPLRVERGSEQQRPPVTPLRFHDGRLAVVEARQDRGVRPDPGELPVAEEGEPAQYRRTTAPERLEERMPGRQVPEAPGRIPVHEPLRDSRGKRRELLARRPRQPARSGSHHQAAAALDKVSERARGSGVEAARVPDQRHLHVLERAAHRAFAPGRTAIEQEPGRYAHPEGLADVDRGRIATEIGDPDRRLRVDHQVKAVVPREAVFGKPHFGGERFTRSQHRGEPGRRHPVGGGRHVRPVHAAAGKEKLDLAAPFRVPWRWRKADVRAHDELLPALGRHRHIRDPDIGRGARAHPPARSSTPGGRLGCGRPSSKPLRWRSEIRTTSRRRPGDAGSRRPARPSAG